MKHFKVNSLLVVKCALVVSVLVMIAGSVYYLVSAVKILHMIIEQLDRAQRLEDNDYPNNQLTTKAKEMLLKHEKTLTVIIALSTTGASLSILGLMATVREYTPLVLTYGLTMGLLFGSNFLVVTHVKPWLMALMVVIVLLAFSFAYCLRQERRSGSADFRVPSVEFQTDEKKVPVEDGRTDDQKSVVNKLI